MNRLFFLSLFVCFQATAQTDTIKMFFDIGKHEATAQELIKLDIEKSGWQKVNIVSYTDYLGTESYNQELSLRRSREIRSRLVQRGLNTERLGDVVGKGILGQRLEHSEGIQENRRTDIIIWKNSINEDAIIVDEIVEEIIEEIGPAEKPKVELQNALSNAVVGDHLILSDMVFLPGQHFLTEESAAAYDELFQVMKNNPTLKINIEGHICCKIDDEDGLDVATNKYNLSEARAEYVYDILIEDGIAAGRLSFEGFAREKPLYPDEKTEDEKEANRRVEIRIIEK